MAMLINQRVYLMGVITQLITGGPPPVDQWPTGTDLLEVPTIYFRPIYARPMFQGIYTPQYLVLYGTVPPF